MKGILSRGFNRIRCLIYLCTHPFLWGHHIKLHGIPRIECPQNIFWGKNISINENVYIQGKGKVYIGDNVVISYGATILTRNLNLDIVRNIKTNRRHVDDEVRIGDYSWIAANATLLPGTNVPSNCVIAAGAVASGRLPSSHAIYTGIPAKVIKKL